MFFFYVLDERAYGWPTVSKYDPIWRANSRKITTQYLAYNMMYFLIFKTIFAQIKLILNRKHILAHIETYYIASKAFSIEIA